MAGRGIGNVLMRADGTTTNVDGPSGPVATMLNWR